MEKIVEKTSGSIEQVKPSLWTFNFILISLSTFAVFLAFHALQPTLSIYIQTFGGTTKIAGLALTSLTVAAIFARPITGWALDKYGRKIIFFCGLFLFFIPMVIYIWMVPVVVLILLRFLQGLGWGIGNTASATVATDIIPRERIGEGMGYYSIAMSVSMAFSPVFALWIINNYSFRELFLVCSLLTLTSLLFALLIRYPKIEKQSTVSRFVFMEKTALRPAAVILFVIFSYSSLITFFPLYADQQGLTTVGFFFSAMALTTLVSRPLSGIIVDRRGVKGYNLGVMIGTAATAAAMPVLAQASTLYHLILGGMLYGIGFGFIQPTMLALCIRSVSPEKRGAANATYWTAVDMGAAAGSLFWGFVATAYGYKDLFYLTIIPIVIAMIIYFSWRRKTEVLEEF
jgi:MFS family permease